jgi:hypothetical protein
MQKDININIICDENLNQNRFIYTVDFINNHPLKPAGVTISYNKKENANINVSYSLQKHEEYHIPTQKVFFTRKEIDLNSIFVNEYPFQNIFLYSVENNRVKKDRFIKNGIFNFDILEAIFFHISRFEEVFCPTNQLDLHKRIEMKYQI